MVGTWELSFAGFDRYRYDPPDLKKAVGGAYMNIGFSLLIVLVTALGTLATRAMPFVLFGNRKRTIPEAILFLGKVLPPAVMAALVIYSLKHVSFLDNSLWMNEAIAVSVTALIHVWRKNTLLSIGVGTLVYMVLVQGNFL
jgi:branched-subunit amino acid transport protein AzlD